MENQSYSRYMEKLPERFSVRRKNTAYKSDGNIYHLHNELEIIYSLSDNMKCRFEHGIINIPKHSLLILNQSDLHYIYTEKIGDPCDRYVLYFSSNYISDFSTEEINLLECFMLRSERKPVVLSVPPAKQPSFLILLKRMELFHKSLKEEIPPIFGAPLHIRFLLGELLLLTNQLFFEKLHLNAKPASLRHTQLVYDIYEYIRLHNHEALTTETIAEAFLISKTHLYNIFKEVTGMTVSDYITEYRITQAKNLLINSDHSIEAISQSVGYYNLSSFSRAFKTYVNLSPLQYRKKMTSSR